MLTTDYWQLDVFANTRGGGNPLGVVLDAQGWSDAAMQRFATWTNLVETTFVLPPDLPGADYRVRLFTPQREIAFAGHPTLGTAHALLASGRLPIGASEIVQQCAAGPIRIRRFGGDTDPRLFLQSPDARRVASPPEQLDRVQALLAGAPLGATPPACIEGGRRWWVAELASEAAVREYQANGEAIAALAGNTDTLGLCIFARVDSRAPSLVVRAFPAGVGIAEDPASGAANGQIAAWLRLQEPEGRYRAGYQVSQGREIGHDARIDIVIDDGGQIWVGGNTNTVIRGQVEWDPA